MDAYYRHTGEIWDEPFGPVNKLDWSCMIEVFGKSERPGKAINSPVSLRNKRTYRSIIIDKLQCNTV